MIFKCCRCNELKDESEFVKYKCRKRGYAHHCKKCESVRKRAFYYANKEKEKIRNAKYRRENPETLRITNRKSHRKRYYSRTDGEKIRLRKYFRELARKKRETDANYRIMASLRSRVTVALRLHCGKKAYKTMALLGCSLEFFKGYLEARFTVGMTWENYGLGGWTLDHRIPCAEFDLRDPAQQRQCFNYSNIQPMWQFDNFSKADKKAGTHQAELI